MQRCWLSLSIPLPRAVGMGPQGFLRTQNNFKAWGISQRDQSLPGIQTRSGDPLLPRRMQGSTQVLGWFSLFCRWVHHTQPPQKIFQIHFPVPSTAEETKLDIYFLGKKTSVSCLTSLMMFSMGATHMALLLPFDSASQKITLCPWRRWKGKACPKRFIF